MKFMTASQVRDQLRALSECATEAEANARFMNPLQCAIGTYRLLNETRRAGEDIREAAKRAMGAK